ncbi:MAG: hypothetical protein HFG54_15485 [Lachnospiraceae bacterium]|jgi:hypothetical protein|nr:hypothetical protein [Lachnospiraceae bacterium]
MNNTNGRNIREEWIVERNRYIKENTIRIAMYAMGCFSFVFLIGAAYDSKYRITAILPMVYMMAVTLFIRKYNLKGIGSTLFVLAYGFRMCLLPVICACGNFYSGVPENLYINYYPEAILLMCFENLYVFGIFSYYTRKARKAYTITQKYQENNSVILVFAIIAVIISIFILLKNPTIALRFRFLLKNKAVVKQSISFGGPAYYLFIMLEVFAKPIVVITLVSIALKRKTKIRYGLAILISILNILIVSDRRILSILAGGVCMLEILYSLRTKLEKRIIYLILMILTIMTVVYCFYGENTGIRIARKFQIYFAGPALTAIGAYIADNYQQGPMVFIKRLFNNSFLLTGLYHPLEIVNYLGKIIPGASVWTPPMIGSIQYFGILGPLLYIPVIKYFVAMDFRSRRTQSTVKRMIYNYLTLSMSVYIIAYQMEHLYYYMLTFGGLYNALIYFDNWYKIITARSAAGNTDTERFKIKAGAGIDEKSTGNDIPCKEL